jgi:POT family proton-dependent oligopeptide transporter
MPACHGRPQTSSASAGLCRTAFVTDAPVSPPEGFFGHPAALRTLFFTEMWERFSYYGMRALLVLFMVDAVANGGLGLDDRTATAGYGLYTAAVYLAALPGGWVADRLIGPQQAVWYGGALIAAGHFTLAVPGFVGAGGAPATLLLGLALIVVGTGLLKPNISALVGQLYPAGGAARDAGFSIFYMGINLGAMLGPLVCSYLGENMSWHYGFGAAGVGMVLGLIQYRRSLAKLGCAAPAPATGEGARPRVVRLAPGAAFGLVVMAAMLLPDASLRVDPVWLARGAGTVIAGSALGFFAALLLSGRLDPAERRRVLVILALFLGAAVFWSGFEQAGSTLNLFAQRFTDRSFLGSLFPGGEHPAGYYQSVNPLLVIVGAPLFAWLWTALARRNLEPSAPAKFALGLLQLGLGFAVMAWASSLVLAEGGKVLPTWLLLTYLLHTTGELCLSPIGLSWVTKLSPPGLLGQMMGTWFMAAALGNLVGGLIAGHFGPEAVEQMPMRFLAIAASAAGAGVLFGLFTRPLKRMIGGVR